MEREQIERLTIDSAAGQLNADARIMFKEYLAEHPEANKCVEDMLGIYQMTDTAITEKTKRAAKTDTSIADIRTKPHSMIYLLPIARWAAVIAIAAFVGIGIGRRTKSPVLEERPGQFSAYRDSTGNQSRIDIEDTGESFWRQKALAMFKAKPSIASTASMTGPTLWEKYRQLIKDRHYE